MNPFSSPGASDETSAAFGGRLRLVRSDSRRFKTKILDEERLAGFNQSADLSTYPRKNSVRTARATAIIAIRHDSLFAACKSG